MKPKSCPEDAIIGRAIRRARRVRGLTQQQLADAVGISFQQIQKYEKGINRISVVRLKQLARFLGVDAADFLLASNNKTPRKAADLLVDNAESAQLLKFYWRIRSPEQRQAVLSFLRSLPPS